MKYQKRNLESVSVKNTKLFSPHPHIPAHLYPLGPPQPPPDPTPRFMRPSFYPSMSSVFAKTPPVQPTNNPPSPRETDASVLFSQAEKTTASGLYAIVSWRRRPARIPTPMPAALVGVLEKESERETRKKRKPPGRLRSSPPYPP
jgi:hypothetical protein